jgi:hypothetical protein
MQERRNLAPRFRLVYPARQNDIENRPAARGVAEADLTTKPFDDLSHDAEAESGSILCPGISSIGLCEFIDLNSAGIPGPWSRTRMTTVSFRRSIAILTSVSAEENLIAFDSKFVMTWTRRSGSALTWHSADATSSRRLMPCSLANPRSASIVFSANDRTLTRSSLKIV